MAWAYTTPFGNTQQNYFKNGKDIDFDVIEQVNVGEYVPREKLLISGNIDIVAHSLPAAIRVLAPDPKLGKIIGIEAFSDGAEGIVVKDNIRKVRDLLGKKIGFPGEVGKFYVGHILKKFHFPLSKIEQSIPYFCKTKRREERSSFGKMFLKFLRNPDFSAENSGKILIE